MVRVQSLEQALEQANSALTGHSDNTESPREGQGESGVNNNNAQIFQALNFDLNQILRHNKC